MASPLSGKPGQVRWAILQSLSANNNRPLPFPEFGLRWIAASGGPAAGVI